MRKLPLKTRILQYAIEKDAPFTIEELQKEMSKEYPGERFCNEKYIDRLVLSCCGVKVMEPIDINYDDNNNLQISYQITNFGKSYKKMIPGNPEHDRAKFFQF